MLSTVRATATLVVAAAATLSTAEAHARARAESDAIGIILSTFDAGIEAAKHTSIALAQWAEAGYARRPAVMIGLACALLVPLLVAAGGMIHRRAAMRAPRPAPKLIELPATAGAHIEFEGSQVVALPPGRDLVQIGRQDDNDICINDDSVQRYHAVIERLGGDGFAITDVSGLADDGLRINGRTCYTATLANGDMVELGRTRMRFATAA